MKTVAIVQARMRSSRLPGKVLREVLGRPLLAYQLERMRRARLCDDVVVAATEKEADDPIAALCGRMGVSCCRGPEFDVLSRIFFTAREHRADAIVRVGGNCPLIDPKVVDRVAAHYVDHHPGYDYVSNGLRRSYPRGMEVEVFSYGALREAYEGATLLFDRERVTPFIYGNPRHYRLANVIHREDRSLHRWTVDTEEDFEFVRSVIEDIYPIKPDFTMEDVFHLLAERSDHHRPEAGQRVG